MLKPYVNRLILLLACLFVFQPECHAYDDILEVNVGDTFTVNGGSYRNIQGVLWDYDTSVFETVSVNSYSTRGKFKAISPSPSAGSVIQATIYYYKDGTTSSGVNKAVASWKVYVADDGSESTVSLPVSMSMELGGVQTVTATPSSSKYSGEYTWKSSNHFTVEVISSDGNTAKLRANAVGSTYIHVTLDNGNTDAVYVTVKKGSASTVTASPASGSYEKGTKITLTASVSGATIRYTTDGTTPTQSSKAYTAPLTLDKSFTLKARAYHPDREDGPVVTMNYSVKESSQISFNIISSANKTVEVAASPNKYQGDIVIPEKAIIGGVTYSVVRIGENAFENCANLTSIKVPNTVIEIRNGAFNGCSGLKSLRLEDGEKPLYLGYNSHDTSSIGKGLFADCPLKSLYLGRNLNYQAAYAYGESPFYHKTTFTELTISSSVTKIAKQAFYYCDGLKTVKIPSSVTEIGEMAFGTCKGLTSVTIPNSVTIIGDWAFRYCNSLKSIIIPESVKRIGEGAFAICAFASIAIPRYVTEIGKSVFWGCSNLANISVDKGNNHYLSINGVLFNKDVSTILVYPAAKTEKEYRIPESVTEIDKVTFYGCRALTSVEIPNSVTRIGERAFSSCANLSTVKLPNTLRYLGSHIFGGAGLESIFSEITDPSTIEYEDNTLLYYDEYDKVTLYVPRGSVFKYTSTSPWSKFKNIRPIENAGVDDISADEDADKPFEVYNLNGAKVGTSLDGLAPGIYVKRQGGRSEKVIVR